jgi:hypothetical protein
MKSLLREGIAALALLGGLVVPVVPGADDLGDAPVPVVAASRQDSTSASGPLFPYSACRNAGSALASTAAEPPMTPALAMGLALADFTGDGHPDLATVEVGWFDPSRAHYSIEIRLTEGGGQSLRLTAPFGGLLVTPKDVTGNGTLDLIVRAAGSRAPVAVFLNDGCGHFSATEPAAFAKVLAQIPAEFGFTSERQLYFSATLASAETYTIKCRNASVRNQQEQDGSLLPANDRAPSHLFLPFGSSRAPPSLW